MLVIRFGAGAIIMTLILIPWQAPSSALDHVQLHSIRFFCRSSCNLTQYYLVSVLTQVPFLAKMHPNLKATLHWQLHQPEALSSHKCP